MIDEAALIEALRAGRIAHAALDVFDEEPLPAGHPLTTLERVTLSAHSGLLHTGGNGYAGTPRAGYRQELGFGLRAKSGARLAEW